MKKILFVAAISLFIFSGFIFSQEEARLLRFPAVYNNQVVFTYAGDLYSLDIDAAGKGIARKITNHKGYEMFARFSPDGKSIAFTAQYDGNTEVYLMDARGSEPKRLTYTPFIERDDVSDRMGPNNIVMTWKHDNKSIIFRSRAIEPNDFIGQLFQTDVNGNMHQQLPLPRGGFCSFSPDDKQMAYNRVFREFRTWKRYRGGMADDIWIYDFNTKAIKNITNNPAQDIIPMWLGENIYFLSDRDDSKRLNLFVYNVKSGETKQLTQFKDYDCKFPSLGSDKIAFENGGFIYLFDTKNNETKKLEIYIEDDHLNARGSIKNVKDFITNRTISPDGNRALFGARGEIFTIPAKHGEIRNLTNTPGVHERNSQWSPDGKWIAYVSDLTGENEIYIMPQDGNGKPVQLTQNADTYYFEIMWSPDSKKILFGDKKLRLRYVDVDKKTITEVFKAGYNEIRDFAWSPDSKWIAFSNQEANQLSRIYIYSLEKAAHYPVTDEWYTSTGPNFSTDGKYLFFKSDRDFNPTQGSTEFNFFYRDMTKIYMVTLAKETPSPFKPQSDEVNVAKAPDKSEVSKDQKKKAAPAPEAPAAMKVDTDGIINRIIVLPIKASTYGQPLSAPNCVYYSRMSLNEEKPSFCKFDLEKQKEIELGSVSDFVISSDHKKMFVAKDESYAIIDLPEGPVEIKEPLKIDKLEMNLDLKSEWANIYYESWRQMRDFFYLPSMHGVNWEAMKKKYEPLLKYVNHRNDLTYIIGELISELSIGHAYTGGGERPELDKVKVGLLGAKLEKDPASGYYRIKKILKGQNWDPKLVSPLTVVGVDAKEGDYIISINGKSTSGMKNIYEALNNTVGKQVRLALNAAPSEKGVRDVVVIPVVDEQKLYYYNWILDNIEKVNKATGGKVGYIHMPDMSTEGFDQFSKLFYPQINKKAVIFDDRGNGGGFVSPLVAERLSRQPVFLGFQRNSLSNTDPRDLIYGPKVCLIDEFSASDGDIFPYRFKKMEMGKLIGKRTWGGVTGIREALPLLDGGILNRPEFGIYSLDGKNWIVEGHGVEPDIFVDDDPAKEFEGIDEQLNKAIEVIMEELKTQEKTVYPKPAVEPDKSVK